VHFLRLPLKTWNKNNAENVKKIEANKDYDHVDHKLDLEYTPSRPELTESELRL